MSEVKIRTKNEFTGILRQIGRIEPLLFDSNHPEHITEERERKRMFKRLDSLKLLRNDYLDARRGVSLWV